jgi:hypothetical protein
MPKELQINGVRSIRFSDIGICREQQVRYNVKEQSWQLLTGNSWEYHNVPTATAHKSLCNGASMMPPWKPSKVPPIR